MFIVFFSFALLASAMIANKIALVYLPPTLFVALRMLGAGSILLFYFWGKTHRIRWNYFRSDLVILLSISLLTTLVPSIFKAFALKHMISAKFSLLGSIDPFVTAFYSYILWHEKLNFQKLMGIIIAFIGVLILLIGSVPENEGILFFRFLSYPEIAALLAPMLGRAGWMMVQYLLRSDRYTSAEINGLTMMCSGIAAFFISIFTESWVISYQVEWPTILISLLYTIIVGNIIALTIYGNLLKTHTATFISLSGFSVNFFVAFYGWLILKEIPSWNFFLAAFLMFAGLFLFSAAEYNKKTIA